MAENNYAIVEDARLITHMPSEYFAVKFVLSPGETTRTALLRNMNFANCIYPEINLTIEAPCGEKVFYKNIDDFPLIDTLCTCGNPNHYFVKIGE